MLRALLFLSLLLSLSSCHRTTREVWEDTKTAGHYMNKGITTLFNGKKEKVTPQDPLLALKPYEEDEEVFFIEKSGDSTPIKITAKELSSKIPGIDSFLTPSGTLQTVFQTIYFSTDSYKIERDDYLKNLKKVSEYLALHPNTYVFVEGHADERGPAAYNLSLGSRRANTIRSYLTNLGISGDQIFTTSYGKEKPIASGHEESAWKKNRRSAFKIYEKK